MANVEMKDTREWLDLGTFKSIKCRKLMGIKVCTVKFNEGTLTLSQKELDRVCKK